MDPPRSDRAHAASANELLAKPPEWLFRDNAGHRLNAISRILGPLPGSGPQPPWTANAVGIAHHLAVGSTAVVLTGAWNGLAETAPGSYLRGLTDA